MFRIRPFVCGGFLLLACILQTSAQQSASSAANAVVPTLVNFSGILTDVNGKPLTGVVGVTFYLYKDEQGGSPLWIETQNVQPNKTGHYSVMLGSTRSEGLPGDLFASGEARWLGVQAQGQAEQPRVMLLSVPYALKAGDAATIGGLPPSAFVMAAPPSGSPASSATSSAAAAPAEASASSTVTTTGGTVNTIPMFTTATNIQNSIVTQTSTTAINVRGKLNLPAIGTATSTKGFNSQPQDFVASVFNSGTSTPVPQTFQWQAEPVGNNTGTASGSLNLLYATGTATPAETGLKISSKGLLTFATGQTFPGGGTVKSVGLSAPATDFTVSGSPVTTTGMLNFAWKVAPTSANTANAIVKRDSSGSFSAGTITAGALNGNGAGLFNVNAAALGGFGPGAFAQLSATNNFTANQTITGNLTLSGAGHGLTFPDGTTQSTHQIVVPAGINDFTQQFGSPTQGKVSYGTLIPVPCWTLPQAGGSCIIATTVIPPGVTTPTVIVDVQASSAGTASVNLGSTGVAANAAPPSNCINFNTTQNLTFSAANTMQRFSTNINTLGVCGSNPPTVAGAGDILVFRICNLGAAGTLDFSVTSVQFLWQ
jgi:hypothetical protein